ncbi:hypothetical protein D3C73_1337620 [compost metagenome]
MFEALGHLLFGQAQVVSTIEIDRRRRQMHQSAYPLLEAGFDHVLGDLDVALMEILITPP